MKEAWILITNILKNPLPLLWGLAIVALCWWLRRRCYLRVPPQQVAVIFNPKKGAFEGFWTPGRYLLVPGLEFNKGSISTASATARGSCEVDSRDGYPVVLEWVLDYRLDPCSIDPALQPTMAGILLSTPTRMAEVHMGSCLKKIAERYNLEALQRDGLQPKVNTQSSHSIIPCLAAYGILVEKIQVTPLLPSKSSPGHGPPDQSGRRLGERKMSRLAEPRSNILNRARSKNSAVHAFDAHPADVSTHSPKQDRSQEIDYYDAMARDICQNAEVPRDLSIGKLVV